MVKVAIAGGTRGVGRSIIDALRADEEYEAIILTRKVPDVDLGFPVIAIDYNDVNALRAVFKKYQIETVIFALAMHIIGVGKLQLNLIQAVDKSTYTKRFMTSTWAAIASVEYLSMGFNTSNRMQGFKKQD